MLSQCPGALGARAHKKTHSDTTPPKHYFGLSGGGGYDTPPPLNATQFPIYNTTLQRLTQFGMRGCTFVFWGGVQLLHRTIEG